MELHELKLLAAASLLAGEVQAASFEKSGCSAPTQKQIELAVKVAGDIWDEVLRQDREG